MVNLTYEASLLQKIDELATNRKTQDLVEVAAQEAELSIIELVRITRQRINAAKFYFNAIQNMESDFYLGLQVVSPAELEWSFVSKSFVNFTDNDFHVEINLLNNNSDMLPENSALVVFIVLGGFFSNLVSLEDCIAKIINIVYDLKPSDDRPSYIRKALDNKFPNGNLIRHLRVFHAIDQNGKPDKKGSTFNIAREIRHQLVHDDIDGVMISSSSIALTGSPAVTKLYFRNSFFHTNTDPAETEMITFCQNVYNQTIKFLDKCYRIIHDDLLQNGIFPITSLPNSSPQ